ASEDESTPAADSSAALTFDIDKVRFERIKFHYHDEVIGTSADIDLKHFDTRVKTFDLSGDMAFNIPNIRIDGLQAQVEQWAVASAEEAPDASDFGVPDPSAEASTLMPDINIRALDLKDILIGYRDQTTQMDTK